MNDRLQALIDTLDVATSERMVRNALRNHVLSCGFERFAYFHSSADEKVRTLHNYPAEWEEMYLGRKYSTIDPVVAQAKRNRDMFFWSATELRRNGVSSEVKSFLSLASDFGIRTGATIPVEGSFGTFIMLTFATSRARLERPERGDALRSQRAALAVHYRLSGLADPPSHTRVLRLSARETICLRWLENGSTMQEIAALMGIQYRTVQYYLDNARSKLQARNLTQAVAIAKDNALL